jgi:hypothetical protein
MANQNYLIEEKDLPEHLQTIDPAGIPSSPPGIQNFDRYSGGSLPPALGLQTDLVQTNVKGTAPVYRLMPVPPSGNPQVGSASQSSLLKNPAFITAQIQTSQNQAAIAALQQTTFQGAWSSTASYSLGAQVDFGGSIYVSLQNNNLNNSPSTSTAFWQATGGTSQFLGNWSSSTAYTVGSQVIDLTGGGGYYICTTANTNKQPSANPSFWQLITPGTTTSYAGNYSGATVYTAGQIVSYQGSQWVCISPTTGNAPSTTSSFWTLLGSNAAFMGTWNSGTAYTENMTVERNGNFYQAIQASTNQDPVTATAFWQLSGPATLDNLVDGTVYIRGIQYAATTLVVPNGNFEASASLPVPGWYAGVNFGPGAGSTLSYDTATPQSGNRSVKVSTTVQFGAALCIQAWAVTPGQTYLVEGYVKSDGTGIPNIQLSFLDKTGAYLGSAQAIGTTSTSWAFVSGSGVVPANAVTGFLGLYNNSTTSSAVEFDQINALRLTTLGSEVQDGPSNFSATASTLTYRPTSNPLTATDAGTNASVNVAAFTMLTSSKGSISVSSGSITALSYSTLYYIYYDDPTLAGGSVTFAATTTKTTAINGSGRFFVGSIITPAATAPNTTGNNDGGVGASFGQAFVLFGGLATPTTSGGGSVTNPNNAIDGNPTTFAEITNGATAPSINQLVVSGFSPFQAVSGSVTLNVRSSGSNVAVSSTTTVKLEYSLDGGVTWTLIQGPLAASSSWALQTNQVSLSLSQNTALVQVRATVNSIQSTANLGDIKLYEAYITVIQ